MPRGGVPRGGAAGADGGCGAQSQEDYPAGVGIFKEFLQNADDAGARRFAVLFDRHSHQRQPAAAPAEASAGLLAPEMEEWQGPALYVYNDAVFSEGDFESISHVGRSGKQDDLAKIGAPCLCPPSCCCCHRGR